MKIAIITSNRGLPLYAVKASTHAKAIKKFIRKFEKINLEDFKTTYGITFVEVI